MEKLTNSQLISETNTVRKNIEYYYQKLDLEAVWLFIATLACWSVNDLRIQFLALSLVITLYLIEVFDEQKGYKSSHERIENLEESIKNSLLNEDTKKARLYDLNSVKEGFQGLKTRIQPRFIIGYGFWGYSFVHNFNTYIGTI